MRLVDKAKEYGKLYAEKMFQEFYDKPHYRGPNFTWNSFATSCANLAAANFPLSLSRTYSERLMAQCDQEVVSSAKQRWIELVKQHNLRDS